MVARTALSGIATGVILAIARVAGETAPLLFTAFGNRFWSSSLFHPINTLAVLVYTYAISPYYAKPSVRARKRLSCPPEQPWRRYARCCKIAILP